MTQRTAGLDLDWEMVDGPAMTYWLAELPAIPGYPDSAPDVADGGAIAEVFPGSAMLGGYTFFLSIAVPDNGQCVLTNEDFHIPNADTAEEAMGEVESLSLEEISDKVAESGYAPTDTTASRKPRHATRRKADMSLDWVRMGDDYGATLPAVPGYQGSYPDEVRVCSRSNDDDVWLFEMLIGVGDDQVPLYNYDFGIPYGGSADEMMDAVENLDPQDIADVLGDFGFAPDED